MTSATLRVIFGVESLNNIERLRQQVLIAAVKKSLHMDDVECLSKPLAKGCELIYVSEIQWISVTTYSTNPGLPDI